MKILFEEEVNYLGVLIENQHPERIVALSTSDVFADRTLIPRLWGMENESIDSGIQAHLYTKPRDIFVFRIPSIHSTVIQNVSVAIGQNYEIWLSLTGLQISSSESKIILVSDQEPKNLQTLPVNFLWQQGNMLEASQKTFKETGFSYLAFTINNQVIKMTNSHACDSNLLNKIVQTNSQLMDKNSALDLLQLYGIDCAKSWLFNQNTSTIKKLSTIPKSGSYVLKPSGGAAGIGLYGNNGKGVSIEMIQTHIEKQSDKELLPDRFQIQEFLPGKPHGVSAFFNEKGEFEILEIHQQFVNPAGKFTGGRWTPEIEKAQRKKVTYLYRQLSEIKELTLAGLICMDFIDGKIIEINPRITASSPIAHILRFRDKLKQKHGNNFSIRQIDLNTILNIPFQSVKNGKLKEVINRMWQQYKVLCLPQGLNPYGVTRMIFINDNYYGSVQKEFIKTLNA
jgi:ATP-grasp domain-containing protein